jgi:hypothetical protein
MYLFLCPRAKFERALAHSKAGQALVSRAIGGRLRIGNAQTEGVPPMFCEGTGHIDPIGYTDPLLEQRKYAVQHMPSFRGFKKEIPHEECGESPFYLANLFSVSDSYLDAGVGGFVIGQAADNDVGMTRGAYYTDMLAGKDTLRVMPQPPMPPAVQEAVRAAVALRPPHRDLVLDTPRTAREPLLDRFVAGVQALKRPRTVAGSVDFYARPHHLNDRMVGQMIRDAQTATRVVDAAYEVENITNDGWGYRIRLFVE